jgi:hypothetical protein
MAFVAWLVGTIYGGVVTLILEAPEHLYACRRVDRCYRARRAICTGAEPGQQDGQTL